MGIVTVVVFFFWVILCACKWRSSQVTHTAFVHADGSCNSCCAVDTICTFYLVPSSHVATIIFTSRSSSSCSHSFPTVSQGCCAGRLPVVGVYRIQRLTLFPALTLPRSGTLACWSLRTSATLGDRKKEKEKDAGRALGSQRCRSTNKRKCWGEKCSGDTSTQNRL